MEVLLVLITIAAACFVRSWSVTVMGLYLPSAIIERGFASKFVADYEKCPRSWIYRTIIPSVYIAAALNTACALMGEYICLGMRISQLISGTFTVMFLAVTSTVFFITCCIAYITIFRRNFFELRDINRGVKRNNVIYTLSKKFQLTENLKVMKVGSPWN
ncbi:hypothetical protein COOONC_02849 [Cooperia oncophora]